MKRTAILISIGALFSLFAACTPESEKETLLTQEVAIDRYITAQLGKEETDSTRALDIVFNAGSYRLIYVEGKGATVQAGSQVEFKYIASVFNNGRGGTFDTNIELPEINLTESNEFYPRSDLGKGIAGKGFYIPGLDKGLIGMKEGEYAQVLFSASQGYGSKAMGIVPTLSPLIFDIWLLKVNN